MPPSEPQMSGPITTADSQRSGRLVVDAGSRSVKNKLSKKKREQIARNFKSSSAPDN